MSLALYPPHVAGRGDCHRRSGADRSGVHEQHARTIVRLSPSISQPMRRPPLIAALEGALGRTRADYARSRRQPPSVRHRRRLHRRSPTVRSTRIGSRRFTSLSISTEANAQPNVSVQSVVLTGGHRSAAGVARVVLSGHDVEGKRTEAPNLRQRGRRRLGEHQWSTASTATIEVPWWPLDSGARALAH